MPNKENIFAKKDDVADFIKNNIKLSVDVLDVEIERGISSSDLTRCARYLYYKNADGIPEKVKQIIKQPIVEKWKKIFLTNKLFDIVASSYECRDIKYNLVGAIDLIVKVLDNPRKPFAVMIKCRDFNDFSEIKDGKIPRRDIVEIMANMWMAEIEDGILLYENNQDASFEVFHVIPDTYLINTIKAKCKEIPTIVEKPQDRPYDKISTECEKCFYRRLCWKQE